MIKQTLYEYLGTNGVLLTPIHLEDVYFVRKIKLTAEKDKILIHKDDSNIKRITVVIPEQELELWSEVDYSGQE